MIFLLYNRGMFYEVIPGRGVGRLETALTYSFDSSLSPGTIVEVPIGRIKAPGIVVKKVAQPSFQTRPISRILYTKPLPSHLIKTAEWLAKYYQAPLSVTMGMMMPIGVLKKRRKTGVMAAKTEQQGAKTEQTEHNKALSGKTEQLAKLPFIELNHAQKMALEALKKAPEATKLLFGVTGSGKTNIYLEMALNALKRQKSVVLLVPEIALTGQLVRIFQEVFGDTITMIHSKQTEVERQRIFDFLLYSETPRIVVGPRSALFAPLSDLGLIIIDEEHETTYYQENPPRYSAIRAASFMAKTLGCDLILGSATPTVSDYYLAEKKDSLVTLSEKAKTSARKPDIKVIDFKNRDNFSKNRYFSNELLASIADNLENKRQTLIFHNRRGSSPLTICDNCGEELLCPNCYLPLTLHADKYELVCHTCGFHENVPVCCPKCKSPGLIHKGFGTKLLESELVRLFPKAKIRRFDADNKKGEGLEAVYSEVKDGSVDILVGTQTLAKGLDLPKLATVGVVQADAGLSLPDFAAEERVFQLLTQVIGRVGRGHIDKAEVIIQTFRPEHPVLDYAVNEDYVSFSKYLLNKRYKSHFPPFKHVMRLDITLKTEALVLKKVRNLYAELSSDKSLLVSPPMPAFHERTNRGYTWQLVVRSSSRKALIDVTSGIDKNFRVTLDPPSLL